MNNNTVTNDNTDEIICTCSGTSRGKIIQLVEQGIVDSDTISRKTGAMSGCGSCDYLVETLLEQLLQK